MAFFKDGSYTPSWERSREHMLREDNGDPSWWDMAAPAYRWVMAEMKHPVCHVLIWTQRHYGHGCGGWMRMVGYVPARTGAAGNFAVKIMMPLTSFICGSTNIVCYLRISTNIIPYSAKHYAHRYRPMNGHPSKSLTGLIRIGTIPSKRSGSSGTTT